MPSPSRPAVLGLAAVLLLAAPAAAVIKKLTPLKEVLEKEELIFVATVDKVLPDVPAVVLKAADSLKGKAPFDRLPINLTGDSHAKMAGDTRAMLDRLAPGAEVVVFAIKSEGTYPAFGFLNGTWFQMRGTTDADTKAVRWEFLHCEPYFRRTFAGTTAELKTLVTECLAGKRQPPPPDETAAPGLGPVPDKRGSRNSERGIEGPRPPILAFRTPRSALFGVIPSFVLIGPLAVVAALFPGVFARLAVGLTRWRAFLTVASVNSTLALAYYFARQYAPLPDSWWVGPPAFASYLIAVNLLGLAWAGLRYRKLAANDPALTAIPTAGELAAFAGLAAVLALLVLGTALFAGRAEALLPAGAVAASGQEASGIGKEFAAIAVGMLAAAAYAVYRLGTRCADGDAPVRLSLSGESVGLAAMALFSTALLATSFSPARVAPTLAGEVTDAAKEVADAGPRLAEVRVWFETPDFHEVMSAVAVSGDRVYLGAMKATGFHQSGAVLAVDRGTGKEVWRFTDDGGLMPVFTTPAVSGARVFAGEGLHTDSDRRLFALDAGTGKPLWHAATVSHTEGSPRVVNGKVYFSAGDDGMYCVTEDAGREVWHLRGHEQKLHVDTPPAVAGGRVFLGSGYTTLAVMALDADTGKELWRVPTALRSFGPPLPLGKHVAFGLGTGNLAEDLSGEPDGTPKETTPAGAVLCLAAATGKEVWRFDLPKSVHTELAADARAVYAACRDGSVVALDRASGKLLWRRSLGASMTCGPAVVSFAGGAVSLGVYAVSADGLAACLSPADGRVLWSRPLADVAGRAVAVLASPVVVPADAEGRRRFVYVGAGLTTKSNSAKAAAVFRIEDVAGVE